MNFFGISTPDIIVILILAIIVFGPDKIPSMAAQAGKLIRDFRRYTNDLTKEFNEATGGLRDEFQQITSDLRGELEATQADLRSQLDLTGILNETTAALHTAGTTTAVAAQAGDAPVAPVATLEASATTAVAEPPPTETITVSTPYAEALAAAPAVNEAASEPRSVVANGNGHGNGNHRATKSDPFADLVHLSDVAPHDDAVRIITPVAEEPIAEEQAISAVTASIAAENGASPSPNGHTKVGGSVAGSKYTRRKSA